MTSGRTGHWTRMRRSLVQFSGPVSLVHAPSLAVSIITTPELKFSVHTATLAFTESDLARAQGLTLGTVITQQTFDQRTQAKRIAEASVAAQQAAERQATLDLQFTELRAPVAGRIKSSHFEIPCVCRKPKLGRSGDGDRQGWRVN